MKKQNIIGTICDCKSEVFQMREEHPYGVPEDYALKLVCKKCGKQNIITKEKSIKFYEQKVRAVFNNAAGSVLEIGCGGGFLTKALIDNKNITKIVAVDKDDVLRENVKNNKKLSFVKLDLDYLDETIFKQKFDYVVCKDVLMQLKDYDIVIKKLSRVAKNMILLNWFNKNHKNCFNKNAGPIKVKRALQKHYRHVTLSYPKLYNWCYLLFASEPIDKQ